MSGKSLLDVFLFVFINNLNPVLGCNFISGKFEYSNNYLKNLSGYWANSKRRLKISANLSRSTMMIKLTSG